MCLVYYMCVEYCVAHSSTNAPAMHISARRVLHSNNTCSLLFCVHCSCPLYLSLSIAFVHAKPSMLANFPLASTRSERRHKAAQRHRGALRPSGPTETYGRNLRCAQAHARARECLQLTRSASSLFSAKNGARP